MYLTWLLIRRWWYIQRFFCFLLPQLLSLKPQLIFNPQILRLINQINSRHSICFFCFPISCNHYKISRTWQSFFIINYLCYWYLNLHWTSTNKWYMTRKWTICICSYWMKKIYLIYCCCYDKKWKLREMLGREDVWNAIPIGYICSNIVH
jgi:hypothetical protein